MILVDTSVWVDFFRARNSSAARAFTSAIENEEALGICGAILQEVLQGVRDEKDYQKVYRYLASLYDLPERREIFIVAASIYRTLKQKGKSVPPIDALIAAVALEYNVYCLTGDASHFEAIATYYPLRLVTTS